MNARGIMSHNAVEKLLWQIGNDPIEAAKFRDEQETYLAGFFLTDRERASIRVLDVRSLAADSVNPLLLLAAYRAINGPRSIPDYMARMNGAPVINPIIGGSLG